MRGSYFYKNFWLSARNPWFAEFKINRKTITAINRMRCGHTMLRESLYRFRIVNSPECLICGVMESPNHVFWECKKFDPIRSTMRGKLVRARGFLPHPVEYLLATLQENIMFTIEKFITTGKIII